MTDGKDQGPVRRPIVVTAILLVAAAVILVAFQSWLAGRPDVVDGGTRPESEQAVTPEPESLVAEPAAAVAVAAKPAPTAAPSGTVRVVVLPVRVESPDPTTAIAVDAVNRAMISTLRASADVDLVVLSPADLPGVVPSNAGALNEDTVVALAVVRRFAAGMVAEIREQSLPDSPFMAINLQASQANGSRFRRIDGLRKSGAPGTGTIALDNQDPQVLGVSFAESILQRAGQVAVSGTAPPEGRTRLLDASQSGQERLRALVELRDRGSLALDSEMLAAVIDLGTRSQSADTRRTAWQLIRRMAFDPALAPALSASLRSDPDAAVRREAALALADYRDDRSYQQALEYAIRNDSSTEVRIAAQMSMMDRSQHGAFARESLLDRGLTPAERLVPTLLNQASSMPRVWGTPGEAREQARAYAEIMAATDDVELKLKSLTELNVAATAAPGRLDPEIVNVLLASVDVEDEQIHRVSLELLRRAVANQEVRAVLEDVVESEPELADELQIPRVLEWRSPGEPAWLRI